MRRANRYVLLLVLTCGAGCGGGDHVLDEATATVGPSGGSVTTPAGTLLAIPPGAVDSDTTITIAESPDPAPADWSAVTPLYTFEPEGTVFAKPLRITFPIPDGASGDLAVYWSKHAGAGYEPIGGTISGQEISVELTHFSSGGVGSATGTRTVSGIELVTWAVDDGITNLPDDLSQLDVEAIVPDGAGGTTSKVGTGLADGTFTIEDVPDGEYLLRIGTSYYVTSEAVIDLGYTRLGRHDATPITSPTSIVLDVDNLSPWQDGDQLELFSGQVNDWYFNLEQTVAAPPAIDDTALAGVTVTSTMMTGTPEPHLIEGSKGDRAVLAQLTHRQSPEGVSYAAMSRIFTPDPFDQTDGGTTNLTGSFVDQSTAETLDVDLRVTEFDALVPQQGPAARLAPWGTGFGVVTLPHALTYGFYASNADLLSIAAQPGDPDLTATGMTYGMPLGGTWEPLGLSRSQAYVAYQLPTATSPTNLTFAFIQVMDDPVALTAGPVRPWLGPVGSPTIAGVDFFEDQTGVGATPTIAWTAPAVGTARFYDVVVQRLFVNANLRTRSEEVATIRTTATSVTLPDGILAPGESYFVTIWAADTDLSPAAPMRTSAHEASTNVLSGIVTP